MILRACATLLLFTLSPLALVSDARAEPPRISRPLPVPLGTSTAMPPLPTAAIDPTLTIGGKELKARQIETRLSVAVQVNGRGPYHFVVDSGADTSVVGLRIAQSQQLPLGSPVILNGMTGSDQVDRVKVESLTLGPSTVRQLELPVLREDDLGGDGLIGIDALARQRLMLDFERRLITVEDARRPMKALLGEIVIVARSRRGQLLLTQVRADRLPVLAVIDTGAEMSIGNTALRDLLLHKGRGRFWTTEAIGVTGAHIQLPMAWIDELQVGPIRLQNVPVAFADVPPFELFGLARQPALMLGTDILETFHRVSLDFRARKVRFEVRQCRRDGFNLSSTPEYLYTRVSSTAMAGVCAH
jgi:predicted aspartyl protease